jgi:hypothetical protein
MRSKTERAVSRKLEKERIASPKGKVFTPLPPPAVVPDRPHGLTLLLRPDLQTKVTQETDIANTDRLHAHL